VCGGYKGRSDARPTFREGKVTHVSFDGTFSMGAPVGAGFSGAPVFNLDSFFVGMVGSGQEGARLQPVCAGASKVHHAFLFEPNPLPGLH